MPATAKSGSYNEFHHRGGNAAAPGAADISQSLDDRHRAELRASGLTADTIERAGIYSASAGQIAGLLG